MPATQASKQVQPLCHEHHSRMEVGGKVVTSKGEERPSYACAEPDCPVHYSDSCGYFMVGQSGNPDELDLAPNVKCRQDGTLMYLAEIKPEKKDFRLWRCPQCGGIRTNDEDLISAAAPK